MGQTWVPDSIIIETPQIWSMHDFALHNCQIMNPVQVIVTNIF